MNDTARLETLLGTGGEVRLRRRDVQEVLQKLRARGAGGTAAQNLESRLGHADELVLGPSEAQALLEELRASGRRWVFGSPEGARPRSGPGEGVVEEPGGSPAEASSQEPDAEPAPEPQPEPEPQRPRRFRLFRRR
jgi:hypothetical protein